MTSSPRRGARAPPAAGRCRSDGRGPAPPVTEKRLRGAPGTGGRVARCDHVELGEVDLADAEVGARVERRRRPRRRGWRRAAGGVTAGSATCRGDTTSAAILEPSACRRGSPRHWRGRRRRRSSTHQPADGVEDVDDRSVVAIGVAHGVGEDRADALVGGEPGHPAACAALPGPHSPIPPVPGRPSRWETSSRGGGDRRAPPRATAPVPRGRGRRAGVRPPRPPRSPAPGAP